MANTTKMTGDEAEVLLKKIAAGQALSEGEREQLRTLTLSMASTIAMLNSQVEELKMTVEILESESGAVKSSRTAALNSLKIIAPPATSIDVDDAMKQAETLRKKVEESNSIAEMAVAAGRFAVGVASKFI